MPENLSQQTTTNAFIKRLFEEWWDKHFIGKPIWAPLDVVEEAYVAGFNKAKEIYTRHP